ncbi:hypothetical protein BB558_002768 [Smittium angustum]|uniref:Interferon-related developmental regulator N-terminal domain-containing protein n=1 Tax=Smittium angustum TaxID=133377 RepID=A0A2U1IV13_SMIAN|nr:hypothetical protein BB558_007446 [Smittium angustum]PWA01180.1 hypothetical protein BB558_002768 [Smittium angustum]
MSQLGNDLLRVALSKYQSSGSATRDDDENDQLSPEKQSGKKNRSNLKSAAGSTRPSPSASKIHSRAASRSASRDKASAVDGKGVGNSEDFEVLTGAAKKLAINEAETKKDAMFTEKVGQFSNEQLISALNVLLDKMSEKRTSTREEGLQGVCSIMAHKYIGEFQQGNKESYLEGFKRCLKGSKTLKEGLLAIRGIALWFVQFGEDEGGIYSDVCSFLTKFISDTDSVTLKAQAIHTISLANFISSNDTREAIEVLKICSKIFTHWQSAELTLLALGSYGLLMSTLGESNPDLAYQIFEKDYEAHLNMLESENVDVRIASSENIALMYEIMSQDKTDFEFDNHYELVEKIEEMSKDSTKKHKKKDKTVQKSALRQVYLLFTENESPEVKLNFKNNYVRFENYTKIFRLNAIRLTVMNGLYMQFVENPLMHSIFGPDIDKLSLAELVDESLGEERIVVDPKSELAKYRSRNMNLLRQNRTNPIPKNVPQNANEHCPGPESEQAGKADNCQGCPNQTICESAPKGPDPDIPIIAQKLRGVKHKLLVLSGKGGVGKSTFSSQLTHILGFDEQIGVGLVDLDICGPSIPTMMGCADEQVHESAAGWTPVYVKDNVAVMSIGFLLQNQDEAVIWRGAKKSGMIKQFLKDVNWDESDENDNQTDIVGGGLDYLIFDTPPGTTDEHLSIVQFLKQSGIDGAVLLTTPQEVSLQDVRKEIDFCRKAGIKIIGVVENMAKFICPKCHHENTIFTPTTGGARAMCSELDIPFLGSIPLDPRIGMSCDNGSSFAEMYPETPAAKAYIQIVENIKMSL